MPRQRPSLIVLGAGGQLGRALACLPAPAGWTRHAAARPAVDIRDRLSLDRLLADTEGGLLVNAAAYTAVDRAEQERDAAYAVNDTGARIVAAAAAERNMAVLHLSTDFVFDGETPSAYEEGDQTRPLSVYGASKLAGESAVADANPRHVILRTAWVFSAHAGCFPRTIFNLLRKQPEVQVVDDQFGCPTAAEHLATAIVALAPSLLERPAGDAGFGLFHFAGQPALSRFAFAQAVAAEARAQGIEVGRVVARKTDLSAPGARRPANSALSSLKMARVHGLKAPDWRKILPDCVKAYYGS